MIQLPDVLGRRPWLSEDPKRRAMAAADSTQPELLALLPSLVKNDPAVEVRLAALARIDDLTILREIAAADPELNVRALAHDKLLKHALRAGAAPFEVFEWLAAESDQDTLSLIARKAADPKLRAAAIARSTRQGVLADCVLHDTELDNRVLAIQKIEQASTLRRLLKALRGTDKSLFAETERRLDAITGDHRHQKRQLEQLNRQAEALLRGETGGDLTAEFARLKAAFTALAATPLTADPAEPSVRRLQGSLQIIEKALHHGGTDMPVIEIHAASAPPESMASTHDPAAAESSPAPLAEGQLNPALDRLQQRLATLRHEALNGKSAPAALARWQRDWRRQWTKLAAPSPADRHCADIVHSWLGEIASFTERRPVDSGAESAADLKAALERLNRALDEGHLSAAHNAMLVLETLPEKLRAGQKQQIRAAGHRLEELRRWQLWANNRRRRELLAELAEFDSDEVHPDAIDSAFRAAFAEWKTLEQREKAAGLPGGGRLWPRLQQTAERLRRRIAPFAVRRERLRESFTESLQRSFAAAEEWLSSQNLEIAAGQRLRRELAEGLRQIDLAKGEVRRQLAVEARRHLQNIAARLREASSVISTRKKELIAAARALQPVADMAQLKKQVRELQQKWQTAGNAGGRREQALWREFRGAIAALYAEVDAARGAREEAERQRLLRAEQLCAEFEMLATSLPLESEASADGTARLAALAAAWRELKPLPKILFQRWQGAERILEERRRKASQERERAHLRTMCSNALRESTQRQQWVVAAMRDGRYPALPPGMNPEWAGLDPEQLEKRLAEQAAAARRVCVEFEYLLRLPSPAADQTLRMQHQVEMLNRQLAGHGTALSRLAQIETLNQRWRDASPMTAKDYEALAGRIAAVHQKLTHSD